MIDTVFEEKLFLKTDGITILNTDPMLSTQREREKLCQIMFEKYNIGR
jgi:actin-related protein